MRQFTTALGLVRKVPPEAMLERTAPKALHNLPAERRGAVIEAVHWSYGAAFGVVFGVLPRVVRERRWAGPVYGVLIWAGFEALIAPALGLPRHRRTVMESMALLGDHVLYGVVVGAAPRPHQDH
ncbi:hypothetical protein [Nonomuraea sp. NPDC002799]